jgi:EAL domain-containing protein (putative c-di-GMP-specific phosphodiesterase class I)
MSIEDFRFLLVEDHGFQRWAMDKVLRELGARHVFSASDGRAALKIVADLGQRLDIVITDLDMPEMDGIEFIRHLGSVGGSPSLIVVSGFDRALLTSVEMMARVYKVRLLGSIEKPVTSESLAALIGMHRSEVGPVAHAKPEKSFPVHEILAALQQGQFEPFFQPQVDMRSNEIRGAEALARWRHPDEGLVEPSSFIQVLEQAGDIDALTTVMLKSAAATCHAWRGQGFKLTLSLNLSQESLDDLDLAPRITSVVQAQGLHPRDIVFEVTESAMASDLGRALENLSRLRMRGFGLSIDDYGTGYASMQQLTRVAFTELKIDQSFVKGAAGPNANRAVLESSLEMAGKLHIPSVAEGVESKREWDLLHDLGCDLAQGYYIARPMDSVAFMNWLRAPPGFSVAPAVS